MYNQVYIGNMQIQIYDLYSIRYGGQICEHPNLSWIVNPKPKGCVLDSFFTNGAK